ncbi:hypothetical protein HDU85_002643 [Gaertneriomyces sp. JEL0708]|nr:hypothetical protein HDU85_002643 [Gaertneriomyces sp. JEL0708]
MSCDVICLLDSAGQTVLDSISTEYEDPFTLESFGDLVQAHREAEPQGTKAFIIARVQTWDHTQPDRAFYSYYNAYQLNKILIKTQSYNGKRLIHRLHVLNPLTNTDIIGNVQYFLVKSALPPPSEREKSKVTEDTLLTELRPEQGASIPSVPTLSTRGDQQQAIGVPKQSVKSRRKPGPPLVIKTGPVVTNKSLDLLVPSPSVRQVEEGAATGWTLGAPSVVLDEEAAAPDLAIEGPNVPAASPKKKTWGGRKGTSTPLTAPAAGSSPTKPWNMSRAFSFGRRKERSASWKNGLHARTQSEGEPGKLTSPAAVLDPGPMSAFPYAEQKKIPIPPGIVSRFAIPVAQDELVGLMVPTSKNRRRSLSYSNSISALGIHTSFEDWLNIVRSDRKNLRRLGNLSSDAGEEYDIVRPSRHVKCSSRTRGGLAPIIDVCSFTDSRLNEGHRLPSVVASAEGGGTSEEEDEEPDAVIYHAVLFATDIDFLESSRVRAIFRENAKDTEDATLFELPPVMETPTISASSPTLADHERSMSAHMAGGPKFCWCL